LLVEGRGVGGSTATVSIDVAERYEALQDEVDLLKNEIKQTLVDLRGFMMEDRTISPRAVEKGQAPVLPRVPAAAPPSEALTPSGGYAASLPEVNNGTGLLRRVTDPLDVIMLGEIISWLGTVKRRGLSLHQITPYVEAYEAVGYLSSVVVKIVLRSMADLDQMVEVSPGQKLAPEEYSECIKEFHEIITTKPAPAVPPMSQPDAESEGPDNTGAMEGQTGGPGDQPVSLEDQPEDEPGQIGEAEEGKSG